MRAKSYSKKIGTTGSELAARLILARLRAGMSQQQVADEVGCCSWTIKQYEAGRRCPSVFACARYATACGTTVSEVLKGF